MTARRKMVNGWGKPTPAKINMNGAQEMVQATYPILDSPIVEFPFREYFKNASNANNMNVLGSIASPQSFFIEASSEEDIFLSSISMMILDDGTFTLDKFGSIAALTNGIDVVWSTIERPDFVFASALKSNLDMIRFAQGNPSFGDATKAFTAEVLGIGNDAIIPVVDLSKIFNMHHGLRLRKGSKDRLEFLIKDDLTAITRVEAIGSGKTINF